MGTAQQNTDAALQKSLSSVRKITGSVKKTIVFTDDQGHEHVAVLGNRSRGLTVSDFTRTKGMLKLEWTSGALPAEFSNYSPKNLDLVQPAAEPMITFNACAPHNCGGVGGGRFGWLLYSSKLKEAVTAMTVGNDPKPNGGQHTTKYSQNALLPKMAEYKKLLDRWIANCEPGFGAEGCANFDGD